MGAINEFEKWKTHYLDMINGKISPNKSVNIVDDTQTGKGLKMVSPAAQKVSMARAVIKRKTNKKSSQSSKGTKKRRR